MNKKDFTKQELIHQGEGYSLYSGLNKITHETIIIKEITNDLYKNGAINTQTLKQQIENTRSFSSPNLVKTYTWWKEDEDTSCQVIERCDINIGQLIDQQYHQDPQQAKEMQLQFPGTIFEQDTILIMTQILQALQDMYELGYVHRNISTNNILVKQLEEVPENFQPLPYKNLQQLGMLEFKLNDFFCMTDELDFDKFLIKNAEPKSITTNHLTFMPEMEYSSPQIIEQMLQRTSTYTSKTDVYSLGLVFYELLYGQPPFMITANENTTQQEILEYTLQMMKNPLNIPSSKPITNLTRDFLMRSLAYKEEDRLSLSEVFKHELFRNNFQNFYKELKNSILNQSKLQTKSAKVITKLRNYVETQNKNLDELFNQVDKDGSGYLDEEEFFEMLQKLDPNLTKDESDSLFRRLDSRKIKQIEKKEFNKIFINKKMPKKILKKVEEFKQGISKINKSQADIFDEYRNGKFLYFMDFNTMINEILPNFSSYDISQLFSYFSDNQIKPMVSKKQFLEKLQISFDNQKDFLLEDDIKEQALLQMSKLKEILRDQRVDILQLFYDNFSGLSDYIPASDIHAVLAKYVNNQKRNVKYIYQYFQYLHNNNKLIHWESLAKALYPRNEKTKQEAMRLVDVLKQNVKENPNLLEFKQQTKDKKPHFFNKPQIKELFQDKISEDELDIFFDYFDLDKDGLISLTELQGYIIDIDQEVKQKAHKQLKKLKIYIKRNEIDLESLIPCDQSRLFNLNSFKDMFPNLTDQEAQYLYQYIDNDGNGRITFDEIKQVLVEQDPRQVAQAKDLIAKLKVSLQKRKIEIDKLFSQNKVGEGKHMMNYINAAILMDVFEKFGMTQEKAATLTDIYGEPKTGMIYFEDLRNLLSNQQNTQQQQEIKTTKNDALKYLKQLSQKIQDKNLTLKKMFDLYDLEGEGCLTYKQMKAMFIQTGIDIDEKQLGIICDFLDSDNDNQISFSEIKMYMGSEDSKDSDNKKNQEIANKAIEKLKKLLKNYDVDLFDVFQNDDAQGDGQFTLNKFKKCQLFQEFSNSFNDQQITAMFKLVAQDKTKIHYKEFIRAII